MLYSTVCLHSYLSITLYCNFCLLTTRSKVLVEGRIEYFKIGAEQELQQTLTKIVADKVVPLALKKDEGGPTEADGY